MLRGCCGAAGCAAHTAGLMLKAVGGSANVLTVTFMKRGKGFLAQHPKQPTLPALTWRRGAEERGATRAASGC